MATIALYWKCDHTQSTTSPFSVTRVGMCSAVAPPATSTAAPGNTAAAAADVTVATADAVNDNYLNMLLPQLLIYTLLKGHRNRINGSRVTTILLRKREFFLFDKVVKLVGEGSVISGAYPV